MNIEILTRSGKLQKRFLPAVYFDSSVLIDYWVTEGMERPERDDFPRHEPPHLQVVRDILRSEIRFNKVVEIRKKLIFDKVKVNPVISPICLLELIEWESEAGFKQIASEASGAIFIKKKSKKEIGDYLKKVLEMRKDEVKEQKRKRRKSFASTGLEILMVETWVNRSFAEFHGCPSSVSLQDTWYYDCGKNSFTRVFTFSGGRLVGISTGGYGFGEGSCE